MTTAGFDQPLPILPQGETERGGADFQDRVLSAMRYEFGGHLEKQGSDDGGSR